MIYIYVAGTVAYIASCAFAFGVFTTAARCAKPLAFGCMDGFHACKWCSNRWNSADAFDGLVMKSAVWPLVMIAAAGRRISAERLHEQKQPSQPEVPPAS